MRRNLNSGKSVYLILLVAFFTLASYFFDQLVIRKEDNLRNLKIKLSNANITVDNISNVIIELTSVQEFTSTSYVRLKKTSNYWFKNLLLINHDSIPADIKQDIMSNFESESTAIWMIKTRFLELYKDIIWTHNSSRKNLENIYQWQQSLFPKYFESVDDITYSKFPDIDFSVIFDEIKSLLVNKNYQHYDEIIYELDKFDEAYDNFTIQDWADFHKYTYNLINNLEFYYNIIADDVKFLEELLEKDENVRNSLIEKITITNSRKNYFILSSIISQILSLLALLILFRVLLLNNKKF
tara:strand:+ start:673 stop:1563 length:891 start_codon:yes stop_codon:yes gene_type:complete